MGNEQGKDKGPTKPIDKNKLEILLKQIYFTAQLNRDRRRGQQLTRDKELLALIRDAPNKRNKENEYHKAAALVNDAKWLKAYEIILRYADILKDNVMVIELSKGDPNKINDLLPYIESVIWGCQKCNLDCVITLKQFIRDCFGQEVHDVACLGSKVTPELKNCFDSILPTEREVKLHLVEFCKQYGIELALVNESGHEIDPEALSKPDPKLEDQPPTNQNTQNNQNQGQGQGQGQFYPGPYPQNPQYQQPQYPQYPQNPQGGFPQQGGNSYPPYNPGPYPNYPQYPQGGYPQGGYPQPPNQGGIYPTFSHHPNFPNGGYPGGNFQGGPQPSYPNGGFPQNPNQGGFGASPQNTQPGSQPKLNAQGSFPINDSKPSGNNQGNSVPQNKKPESKPPGGDASGGMDDGGFPVFQKFTDLNIGGKPSGDPLDELDARLKNIKSGL